MIGIYLRVSSNSQDVKSQEPELSAWARSQDAEVEWYRDVASGSSMDRPDLDRLLSDVRSGKVNRVCVWRLDRLGRTAKGLMTLLDELNVMRVGFVSLREGFDLSTPAGRLMAGVLSSVAAYESEVRRERQMAGIARAKSDGKRWGGRKPGTRIRLTEEKELEILRMYRAGESISHISKVVSLARLTIYRVLARNLEHAA